MRLLIFVLAIITISGCKQSAKIPENFDYGKIEKGTYSNDYFGFDIPVPATWAVQNKEQVQQLQKQGEQLVSGSNKELAAKVRAADINSAILLTVFKNKADQPTGEFNTSFIILAENLGTMSGVKKGDEYLAHAKELMQQSALTYQFPSGFYTEKIGNREFDGMDVSMNASGNNIHQNYYSLIDKNFAVSIIISYVTNEQKNELKSIIDKIKFR